MRIELNQIVFQQCNPNRAFVTWYANSVLIQVYILLTLQQSRLLHLDVQSVIATYMAPPVSLALTFPSVVDDVLVFKLQRHFVSFRKN
jgi:hypothetical protein